MTGEAAIVETLAAIDMAGAGIEAPVPATGILGAGIVPAVAESVTHVAGSGAAVAEIQATETETQTAAAGIQVSVAVFLRRSWDVKRPYR